MQCWRSEESGQISAEQEIELLVDVLPAESLDSVVQPQIGCRNSAATDQWQSPAEPGGEVRREQCSAATDLGLPAETSAAIDIGGCSVSQEDVLSAETVRRMFQTISCRTRRRSRKRRV